MILVAPWGDWTSTDREPRMQDDTGSGVTRPCTGYKDRLPKLQAALPYTGYKWVDSPPFRVFRQRRIVSVSNS